MSKPKRGGSRLLPVLVFLLIVALAGGAVWFFLFRSPAGLANSELTGFLPGGAVITANTTDKKTQTVCYTYETHDAYCDAVTSAQLTFRYADGAWTPDGQEEVVSSREDWSRLAGTWTDEMQPDLTIVLKAFQDGAVAGSVTWGTEASGLFDEFFTGVTKESDGACQFTGRGILAGTYLRFDRQLGLLYNNTDRPMEKDAPPRPSPTPARTLEIEKDGATETVDAASPERQDRQLVATAAVNMRPEPNTDKDPLGMVDAGTVLPCLSGPENGWYEVMYMAQRAYVSATYVQDMSAPDCPTLTLLTADAAVNVRSGPGTGYQVLTTVDAGATMVSAGLSDGWYQIRFNDGYGYVASNFVTVGEQLN